MKKDKDEVVDIDFVLLVQSLWKRRKFLIYVGLISLALGIFLALTSKEEYTSSAKLIPENQDALSQGLGGLGGLAGLAGINLDMGGTNTLDPKLYPQLAKSTPFIHNLISSEIYFEKIDSVVSSFTYFKSIAKPSITENILDYTVGLPGKIKKLISSTEESSSISGDDDILRFSYDDMKIMHSFSKRISVGFDPETGVISLSAKMPDAYASGKLADLLLENLTKQISDYKLAQLNSNLLFIQERFNEAKTDYEIKQSRVANFTNRNRNITDPSIEVEFERLQNDLDISFEVYKGLATQLEQAKIKVKEETPVFTILEPVKIPVEKSNMRKSVIVVLTMIFGLSIGVAFLLFKGPIIDLIQRIIS